MRAIKFPLPNRTHPSLTVAQAAIQGLNQKVEQELRAKDMEIGDSSERSAN
jgi:hypothetical protein